MFDINTVLSAALSAAITEATKPLLERIATLESANDILHKTQHEDMVAMRDRIAALEIKLTEAALFVQTSNVTIPIDEAKMVEALNDQEWFWEKMQRFAVGAAEEAMDAHLSDYDHDNYDAIVSKVDDLPDPDDLVTNDNFEDAVREAIGNLTFEVSVS